MTGRGEKPMARRRSARRLGGRRWLAALGFFAVIVGAVIALRAFRQDEPVAEIPADATVDSGPTVADRAVTLVFPDENANGYLTEQRRIPSEGRPEVELMQVLTELCAGPHVRGAVSGLPRRTRPLAAFLDLEHHQAILDFSAELVTQHPGGSTAEVATLTSILRTVALNFPTLETCRILVDGAEVQTLAGHHVMDRPFALRRWL
jgi:spore germination protein GerM